MSYFTIILALVLPLCQTSPVGYYMSRDHEPPAYRECPGFVDGYYLDPRGRCDHYVECMYVGTSMEMAWVMPCIPGSRFQYPSVCEECWKQNVNDDKINIRVDVFDKSSLTTTSSTQSTTTTTRPVIKEQQVTHKPTVAKRTTIYDTTLVAEEKTTSGQSAEEASTQLLAQTSGHQVSVGEVTTKTHSGLTRAESDAERITTKETEGAVILNVHVTASPTTANTNTEAETIQTTTGGPSEVQSGTEDTVTTTANDMNTSPVQETAAVESHVETVTPKAVESTTSDAEDSTTTAAVKKDQVEQTTGTKIPPKAETKASEPKVQTSPEVSVTIASSSDIPQNTEDGVLSVNSQGFFASDSTKDISRSNIVEATASDIKSVQPDLRTTASDLEQFATSTVSSQNIEDLRLS